jgi:hypothetical protein
MHVAWVQAVNDKRTLDQCPLCIEDVQDIPFERRMNQSFPIPCEKHGGVKLYPENEDAVEMYFRLFPGDMTMIQTTVTEGSREKIKNNYFLRMEPIKMLCDAYGINFLDTLDKLEIIHKAWLA